MMDPNKVVVFTGAGISAESGIAPFRGDGGLWEHRDPRALSSVEAWREKPETVLQFHNERLQEIARAEPNAAHLALVGLEEAYDVIVITQNVDDLHERAGSSRVIHLHGSAVEVRSENATGDIVRVKKRGYLPLTWGETDDDGNRFRPHIVLFGEDILHYEEAREHLKTAGRVLVVGTSLTVEPAASLLKQAHYNAAKVIVSKDLTERPRRYEYWQGLATELVPHMVAKWRREASDAV